MSIDDCNLVRVERHFLGDLDGEEKLTLRLHLEGCEKCRSQLSALENDGRNYLLTHPFREFAAKNLPAEKTRRRSMFPVWLPTSVGVLACLMILPVLEKRLELSKGVLPSVAQSGPTQEGVRSKGEPILEFYCKRDGVVHEGRISEDFRAGDELQFVYAADSAAYVTLASIDAGGLVSLYRAPGEKIKVSLEAKPGNRQSLPFAVTLDTTSGAELFVMAYSGKPLSAESVESWLKLRYMQASANLNALADSLLTPPVAHSKIKSLLLKKTKV